jgi:hypothetical protein
MVKKLYVGGVGRKKFEVLFDQEDYLKYKTKKLRRLTDGRIYYTSGGKRIFIQREILNLTSSWDRVFFKTANKQDMRKSNLEIRTVPSLNRGKYAVQFPEQPKN